MLGQKNWYVILVKPHELEIMRQGESTATVVSLPKSAVNNLEVLDRDTLYALLASWAKEHPYQISELVWLLSPSVVFEQTFPDSDRDRWDTLTVQFLDSVPFEEVLSRVSNPVEGRRVLATNKDLVNALLHGLSMQGYSTKVVVPARSVGLDSTLTADGVKLALSRLSELARENLILPSLDPITPATTAASGAKPASASKPKSSLPLLLSVFLALLAILVIVIVLNK